jgi:excisionase family DNA binding protein
VNLELLTKTQSSRVSDERRAVSAPTRVFGVDELAIFFGCSTEKIKRLARKRELPAFKFGKSWYVREQDLEIYINRAVASNLRSQKERE